MFTSLEISYLADQPLGRLATVGPGGDPQNNPVGFQVDAETGVLTIGGHSMSATRKYRNVLRNPQVSLVVDDLASRNPWRPRGVEVRGVAEADGELIRVRPRTIFSWGIDPDGPRMERRTVGDAVAD